MFLSYNFLLQNYLARTQQDSQLRRPQGNALQTKWEYNGNNQYPNGSLIVRGCDVGVHYVAKYKSERNLCWIVRPSFPEKEKYLGNGVTGLFMLIFLHNLSQEIRFYITLICS